ncbi:MAG: DNA-binding response regulator [Chloroflexi bacterium]|nr:MAG: DNA-binding response regulator [Chloroflexota bacterium]
MARNSRHGQGKIVLVIEDDQAMATLVRTYLEHEGYEVETAETGEEGIEMVQRVSPHVVLLDLMLPATSGWDVLRTLRSRRDVPVIMVTGRRTEEDRLRGFEGGADDYVVKPFSPREVVARVRAVLRRCGLRHEPGPQVHRFGRLEIDEAAREVRIDGIDVGLKPREYSLLCALAANVGVALSRDALLERVWGFDFDGDERTVDVHIRRLRAKIEERHAYGPCVQTLHGFGYKFVAQA